jgi:GDPmannose 4,6-dehydratase
MKCAIVTGATGQDGTYLTELLLDKEYQVFCMIRRTSCPLVNSNLKNLLGRPGLRTMWGDILDTSSIKALFDATKEYPLVEVYNLAAQSDVGVSFMCPGVTLETTVRGTMNLLEIIKDDPKRYKFYQASTSEMFGKVQEVPQNELTPFYPRSPYGVAKLAAHWLVKNYRESYGFYACCGILFNHESPLRGHNFVTKKVVVGLYNILVLKKDQVLKIGNLEAKRDWGHAKDYVKAMWLMLQQEEAEDYVVGTGEQYSVRELIERTARLWDTSITWEGEGLSEVGKVNDKVIIQVSSEFFRPCEVDSLLCDPTKIKSIGWIPEYTFDDILFDMQDTS